MALAILADEGFRFNVAVARIYELANTLGAFQAADDADRWALREAVETLVRLSGPMLPHLAEELWARLGHATLLSDTAWPEADETLLVEDTATVAVQVNGKLRATLELARDLEQAAAEAAALADERVQRTLQGQAPRRVIVVPNRIVNIVV